MTARYPFHEVIAEALTEVFENLIRKSIDELPLTFTLCHENECVYYLTKGDHQKLFAVLYLNYEKQGFENQLEHFWQIVATLRSKHGEQIKACAIGIGLWGLTKIKEFRKNRTVFHISSDHHIIDTLKWYDFELDEDLTMDIDNYIRYQNLPEEEKIEIADVLLEGVQSVVNLAIRSPIKPQPQTQIPSHPSSD